MFLLGGFYAVGQYNGSIQKRARHLSESPTNLFATLIKSGLSVHFLWTWSTMMLFSRCSTIVLCKYNFACRIPLNDRSLVAFVAVVTRNNLTYCMSCHNDDFMPGDNFSKYVETAGKVIFASFLVVDQKLMEKVRSFNLSRDSPKSSL